MNTITIKNTVLGAGRVKIAVPLLVEDITGLQTAIADLQGLHFDIVEFRADFLEYASYIDDITACLRQVRDALPDIPLLFTFRRVQEGGRRAISQDDYFLLLQTVICSRLADIVDIELFAGERQVKSAIASAKANGVTALLSNHDFYQTPVKEEIINRLTIMQNWGADICKIAVMPQSAADVLVLLDAAQTMFHCHAVRPLVAIAMGRLGMISRLAGMAFGSAITFASAKKASAPGQIAVNDLYTALDILENNV